MATPSFGLAELLDPVSCDAFFRLHWERKPLHLRRSNAAYYSRLLTLSDLEKLIGRPGMRFPAIQLSRSGSYYPASVFTEDRRLGPDTFTGVVNFPRLNAEYRAGATVVLPGLHMTWQPLADLCSRLDDQLNHVAHANAYLTPGNTAGFAPHYDTHEILVLQLSGAKRWRVYAPPIELPHRRQPFDPVGYVLPEEPVLEVELTPGDLLYLPRGYVHTTTTSAASSAHVTIGIDVYTWLDLAGEVMRQALTSPKFRAALPPGFSSRADRHPLAEELSSVLTELTRVASVDSLVEDFLAGVAGRSTPPRGDFHAEVTVVQAHTPLVAPDPHSYRLATMEGQAALEFRGRRYLLPAAALPALQAMQSRRTFTASELPAGLDIESRLALVRTLVEKKFLTIA